MRDTDTVTPRPFPQVRPHGELHEVLPGVFRVQGSIYIGPMRFSRNMTVIPDDDGLVLINTVRLNEAGLAALDALGPVRHILRIGGWHGSDDAFYKDRYGCPVSAVKGQRYFPGTDPHKGQTYFQADHLLDEGSKLPIEGASLYVVHSDPPEAILRIPAQGGTLITADALVHWPRTDKRFNLFGRIGMALGGVVKPYTMMKPWIDKYRPPPAEVAGILRLGFDNVLPGHGEPVLGGAAEKFRPAIDAYVTRAHNRRIPMPTEPHDAAPLDIAFAGALTFSEDGVLFVGDNHNGAIYAFEIPGEKSNVPVQPTSIAHIDTKMAELLGVGTSALEINDMAAHPVSDDVYISVTRIGSFSSRPAIVKVAPSGDISLVDLSALRFQKQALSEFPQNGTSFQIRGMGGTPPLPRDIAKGDIAIRSMAIMDMAFHDGELFVAGVAYDNFRSALRRIAYPFDGRQNVASVDMYHIAHDQYESRAPIRAMAIQQIDGKAQLIAAYTCSPVVLVPLEAIQDGAKISAKTIMDIGNGQPLDMVSFEINGEAMLFVTSNSRTPQVIPVAGLNGTPVVTHEDFERGAKLDLHPLMPFGPVGKAVMFEGVPLHIARLAGDFFVSITRDAYTGSLNLDVNPTWFPNRMHHFFAEMDFPKADAPAEAGRAG